MTEVKEQGNRLCSKTKEQVESGEITLDSVLAQAKSCARQATEASKESIQQSQGAMARKAETLMNQKRLLLI